MVWCPVMTSLERGATTSLALSIYPHISSRCSVLCCFRAIHRSCRFLFDSPGCFDGFGEAEDNFYAVYADVFARVSVDWLIDWSLC